MTVVVTRAGFCCAELEFCPFVCVAKGLAGDCGSVCEDDDALGVTGGPICAVCARSGDTMMHEKKKMHARASWTLMDSDDGVPELNADACMGTLRFCVA